jgi:hypothetical protein
VRKGSGFAIGLVLFFLIKLSLISVGLWSKEGPRLGDDAYVYLYYGEVADAHPLESIGPASLAQMAPPDRLAQASDQDRFQANRVLMRTTKNARLFSLWPIKWLPTQNLSYYQVFWLYELAALLVITFGIGCLTAALGVRRLWLSLPLIALAIFPGQGLHFFVPSTLALGVGMGLWGVALSRNSHPAILFLLAIGCLAAHQIGLVHVAVGCVLVVAIWLMGQRSWQTALIELGALIASVVAFTLTLRLFETGLGVSHDFTRFGWGALLDNLAGYPRALMGFAHNDPVTALLSFVGMVVLLTRKSVWTWRVLPQDRLLLLALVLLSVVGVTNLYIIDGYPAEVPFRILTIVMILSFVALADRWEWPGPLVLRQVIWGGCLIGLTGAVLHHEMDNRDSRWPEIDRQVLAQQIATVPQDQPILYLETDYALMAALMAGGMERAAYVPAMLALDEAETEARLSEAPPAAVMGLLPKAFRSRSYFWWPLWEKAKYGFDLRHNGKVELIFPAPGQAFSLNWEGAEPPRVHTENVGSCAITQRSATWFDVPSDCLRDAQETAFEIRGDGIVLGVRTEDMPDTLQWPWQRSIVLKYIPGAAWLWTARPFQTSFDPVEQGRLSVNWDPAKVLVDAQVVSDAGGIVWMVPSVAP